MALTSAKQIRVKAWFDALSLSGFTKYSTYAKEFKSFPCAVCQSINQDDFQNLSGYRSVPLSYKLTFALIDKPAKDNQFASLTTNLGGANNDLVFTSVVSGDAGNLLNIKYVDAGDFNIEHSEGSSDYIVNYKSGVTTAKDVMDFFNTYISTVFTVTNKADNDGTGLISTLAKTYLTGGITDGELYTMDKLDKAWEDIFYNTSSTAKAIVTNEDYIRAVDNEWNLCIYIGTIQINKS